MKESFGNQIKKNKLFAALFCAVMLFFLIEIAYYAVFLNTWFDETEFTYKSWLTGNDLASPFKDFRIKYPPLAFYSQMFFQQLFGPTLLGARILSALFLLSVAALLFAIGKKIGNKWTGLLSFAFLAFHPFLVGYYTSATPYSLSIFFPLLAIWILGAKTSARNKIILATTAMTFSYLIRYNMLPAVGALWIYIIFRWKSWKYLGVSIALFFFITLISFIPYAMLNFKYALVWALYMFGPPTKLLPIDYFHVFSSTSTDKNIVSYFFNEGALRMLTNLFIKYFHLWVLFFSSLFFFITKLNRKNAYQLLQKNHLTAFAFLLGLLFFISHSLVSPDITSIMKNLYYIPFIILAVTGSLFIFYKFTEEKNFWEYIKIPMGIVLATTLIFSTCSISLSGLDIIFFNHFDYKDSDLNRVKKGAEYLKINSKASDKLLLIDAMQHAFLAKRYVIPPLINEENTFYDIDNVALLNKYKFYNANMLLDWLKNDADVVVFQTGTLEEKGSSIFGEDYKNKIKIFYEILNKNFEFAGSIENVYPRKYTLDSGIMNIWKRKNHE